MRPSIFSFFLQSSGVSCQNASFVSAEWHAVTAQCYSLLTQKYFFPPKFSQCLAYICLVTFPAPDRTLSDHDTNEPTAAMCHSFAPHSQPFFHLVTNTFPNQEGHSSRTQSTPGTTTHFWGSQLFSLFQGPWKNSFAQDQVTETPLPEHREQIGAGNTIPEIKPFSVWRNDWEDLPDYLLSSAYKDLYLFAVFPLTLSLQFMASRDGVGRAGGAQWLHGPQRTTS